MTTGPQVRARRSREKILQAAKTVFFRHGYVGTSMDALAELAGVSKQTIYAHFDSKEALFVELVASLTGGGAAAHRQRVEDPYDDQSAEAFLLSFATEQLRIVITPELLELRRLVIAESDRFPELGRALHEQGPAYSIDRLTRAIEHYCQQGELQVTNVPAAASHFNWLLMGEPTNNAMLLGTNNLPGADWLDQHARECVRIFLCAFRADQ